MPKLAIWIAALLFLMIAFAEKLRAGEEPILLWPSGHPANNATGKPADEVRPRRLVIRHSPAIVPSLPKENATGAAVMICPGGGYGVLAIDHEGYEIAEWMNERGIAAFVLKYRCGGAPNTHPAPLDDALRGMQLIRSRAAEWKIDPEKLGVMGFSAGGHLASCVSTLSADGDADAEDPLERQSSRPAFSILCYPVISMARDPLAHVGSRNNLLGKDPDESLMARMTTHRQVSKKTPPTFLVHASDDGSVPVGNSLRYYEALMAVGVPAELHVFEKGGHGFGMRKHNRPSDHWPKLLDRWLKQRSLAE